jgi:hypothetical protein
MRKSYEQDDHGYDKQALAGTFAGIVRACSSENKNY